MFGSKPKGEKISKGSGSGNTRRFNQGSGQGNLGGQSESNGESTPQPSLGYAQQKLPSIPQGLSFIFRIDEVEPDYTYQSRLSYPPLGLWQPPTWWNAVTRTLRGHYLWKEGRVCPAAAPSQPDVFRVATVFSQEPETPQLLAVEYDVTTTNVSDDVNGGWRRLSFRQSNNYSYVEMFGGSETLPFPGSPNWVPELVPACYDCEDRSLPITGLVGKLPLLLSLAAFSCPPDWMDYYLENCIQPHQWFPHGQATGRTRERGMIVSVMLDPASTFTVDQQRQYLKRLENGDYGPMFGP